MKRICLALILILYFSIIVYPQENYPVISVSKDIEITKLSEHAYIHTSYAEMPPWGRVPSNGLIFINKGKVFLFDTPVNIELTKDLVNWIENSLKAEIIGVIPSHWHIDCMGGLKHIHKLKIQTFAYELTREIAKEKGLPVPSRGFSDSLVLKLGQEKVICKYFGPAHSLDNIVVWIPSEKILFAGCMVKELNSTSLGNTADGNIEEWPLTIQKVIDAYPDARIVIPGHGKYGGIDLLYHTLELLKNNNQQK